LEPEIVLISHLLIGYIIGLITGTP